MDRVRATSPRASRPSAATRWRERATSFVHGLGFADADFDRPLDDVLRRAADPRVAGPRAGRRGRPAAARRADQPPRHRVAGVARADAARPRHGDRARRPRPLVPGDRRHRGARARGRPLALLPGHVDAVAQGAGRARDRAGQGDRQAAGRDRAAWSSSSSASGPRRRKAKQAQSRVKALDKIERIDARPEGDKRAWASSSRSPSARGRVIFELEDGRLEVGTPPQRVLLARRRAVARARRARLARRPQRDRQDDADRRARRASAPLDGGRLRTGHNVKVGYLSQHAEELEGGGARTVLEAAVKRTGPDAQPGPRAARAASCSAARRSRSRSTASRGGERRRLSLAILVASGANVLILDEPTNHLDLESREALEDALRAFPGSLLLVTHDRALLDAVGTRTVAVEDHTLRSYVGGWPEYSRVREERKAAGIEPSPAPPAAGCGRGDDRARAAARPQDARAGAGGGRASTGRSAARARARALQERAPEGAGARAGGRAGRGGAGRARGGAGRPAAVGDEVRVGQERGAPHGRQARGRGGLRGARGAPGQARVGRSHGFHILLVRLRA